MQVKSWADVTVGQYIELNSVSPSDFETSIDYSNFIIQVLSDIDMDTVENMSIDEYDALTSIYTFINNPPRGKRQRDEITINGSLMRVIDFKAITIGEFIDLEHFIAQGINNNIGIISSILYRRVSIEATEFTSRVMEPYGDWIYLRAPLFNDVPLEHIYGHILNYLTFRNNLFDLYAGLFDTDEPEDEQDNAGDDLRTKLERSKNNQKNKSARKWGWDVLLFKMAKGDPIKMVEATNMPLIQCFNTLSMARELGLEI
jgi:hypothetical protein